MGQTHSLLEASTTTATSSIVHPQRFTDESGIFQVEYGGSGTFTITIEGRATDSADWYKIDEFKHNSSDDHNDMVSGTTIASVVVLFPQMRANLSANSAATVSAWLVE